MDALRRIFAMSILFTSGAAPGMAAVASGSAHAVMWRNPKNIAALDLYYGPGGAAHAPSGSFTFLKEDLDGTSPKLLVQDEKGIKWTVKLGPEARPETAATRLVWGAGYFTNEDYFMNEVHVNDLPSHLRRGGNQIKPGGIFLNVRLKRHLPGERKVGHWAWSENMFENTREFEGLRVVMSLVNNWDLTDENNAIYQEPGRRERIFMVSDLGSTFGNGELSWPTRFSRGNTGAYRSSPFITRISAESIDLFAPAGADWFFLATPREFVAKARLRWIGHNVPRSDARWIGQVLSRLSDRQIRDAFRAAGYSAKEIDGFASVVEARIAELCDL